EQTKSFAELERLCDRLLELRIERGDLILAFGGGVVGDLAGFAAAILKRGIDHVQVPTTLLAQVDSSVGGKTAINTLQGKNLVGAFHQPRRVLADPSVLASLPLRETACGFAEILKCALIGDPVFFGWLESHAAEVLFGSPAALPHAVGEAVAIKAAIVGEDERERIGGRRALLNLGHTFGHALEAETGFGEALKHGEAVGLGCVLAFRFSARLGLCPPPAAERVARAVSAAGLATRLPRGVDADALVGHMATDKKVRRGALAFVLARDIGEVFVADGVEPAEVRAFLLAEGDRAGGEPP
ncbi:MAG: 3-dehydroquinate synthase, partial [Caulobacteraceae bacterium]